MEFSTSSASISPLLQLTRAAPNFSISTALRIALLRARLSGDWLNLVQKSSHPSGSFLFGVLICVFNKANALYTKFNQSPEKCAHYLANRM